MHKAANVSEVYIYAVRTMSLCFEQILMLDRRVGRTTLPFSWNQKSSLGAVGGPEWSHDLRLEHIFALFRSGLGSS
jgi:hypothetical protein